MIAEVSHRLCNERMKSQEPFPTKSLCRNGAADGSFVRAHCRKVRFSQPVDDKCRS